MNEEHSFSSLALETWGLWRECRYMFVDRERGLEAAFRDFRNSLKCFESVRGKPSGWHLVTPMIFDDIEFLLGQLSWDDERKWDGLETFVSHIQGHLERLFFGINLRPDTLYTAEALQELVRRLTGRETKSELVTTKQMATLFLVAGDERSYKTFEREKKKTGFPPPRDRIGRSDLWALSEVVAYFEGTRFKYIGK